MIISFLLTVSNKYVPQIRPIVNQEHKSSEQSKRKRKLIARDWWQLVIWANRMKNLKSLQGNPRYFKHIGIMKKNQEFNSFQTIHDKLFLHDYIKDINELEKVDEIENLKTGLIKEIWKIVSYTINISSISLDYHGGSSKTCHSNSMIKKQYPLLRFEIDSYYHKYKIDQEGRRIAIKFNTLEVKQYDEKPVKSLQSVKSSSRFQKNEIPLPSLGLKGSQFPNKPHISPVQSSINNTILAIERQEKIMMNYQRVGVDNSFDDAGDEFDSIDEKKIQGINRTIMATKMINKPKTGSFIKNYSSPSFHDNKIYHKRHRFASNGRSFLQPHENLTNKLNNQSKSELKNSFSDNQLFNGDHERVIFSISSENNSGAFNYEINLENNNIKVSKYLQLGYIEANIDEKGLVNISHILSNIEGIFQKIYGQPDLNNDAFWWLLKRNIIYKLKK